MGEEGKQVSSSSAGFWFARVEWPTVGGSLAWLLAAGMIVAGTALKVLLERLGGEALPPYITFYPVVVLAALSGGPAVGTVSAIASVVIAWVFFQFGSTASLLAAIIFACTSVFLGWVVGNARLAFDEANARRAHQGYATRESVHRIKNLVAVVQAIIRKVAREVGTIEQYRDILCQRMQGLEIAQSILIEEDWQDAPIGKLIDSALAPFLPNPGLTLRRGPDVLIPANCVRGLSMALYELCTNSMKFGALADGRGPVLLSWKLTGEAVFLEWDERTTADPRHSDGFGATLIRVALTGDPTARVEYRVDADGVYASFRWGARVRPGHSHQDLDPPPRPMIPEWDILEGRKPRHNQLWSRRLI